MTIRLHFEVRAVYPEADFHSKFLIIDAPEVSTFLMKTLKDLTETTLPEEIVTEICTEDGTILYLYVDPEGICFIDEAALSYRGEKALPVIKEEDGIIMKEFTF